MKQQNVVNLYRAGIMNRLNYNLQSKSNTKRITRNSNSKQHIYHVEINISST